MSCCWRTFHICLRGKVDKRGLESDYKAKLTQSIPDDRGVSEDLRRLCQVLSRVLHVEIGPSTDLGGVGLDSLRAIQVASGLPQGRI